MTFKDELHLRLLGPGTYHPNHPKGVEIHDHFRNSAAFSSKVANHLIDRPTDNQLAPNEYFAALDKIGSVKVHEPTQQNSAFRSTSTRFVTREASNTETEESEHLTMSDLKTWHRTRLTVPPKDRVDTGTCANMIGSKASKTDGADRIYDAWPDTQTRIKRMPLKMRYSDSNPVARFPDNVVKSRYTKESKPMGPASYKIKRNGLVVKDKHKASSAFKSKTQRFKTKKEPLINYTGWNYNHSTMRKAYWSGGGTGSGAFETSHGLKRFAW